MVAQGQLAIIVEATAVILYLVPLLQLVVVEVLVGTLDQRRVVLVAVVLVRLVVVLAWLVKLVQMGLLGKETKAEMVMVQVVLVVLVAVAVLVQ